MTPGLLEDRLKGEPATLDLVMQNLPVQLGDAAYQARVTALNEQIYKTEAELPALNAKESQITTQHQAACSTYLKRIELEKCVKLAQELARDTHQKMLDLTQAESLDIDTTAKLERATEAYDKSAAKLTALSAELAAFVGPVAGEILRLTSELDDASLTSI